MNGLGLLAALAGLLTVLAAVAVLRDGQAIGRRQRDAQDAEWRAILDATNQDDWQ